MKLGVKNARTEFCKISEKHAFQKVYSFKKFSVFVYLFLMPF